MLDSRNASTEESERLLSLGFADAIPDAYARARFLRAWKPVRFGPGEPVLMQGAIPPGILAVHGGLLRVSGEAAFTARRGHLLAVRGFLQQHACGVNLTADTEVTLYFLDSAVFHRHADACSLVLTFDVDVGVFLHSKLITQCGQP
jgi:CRP-like cAMP-binding protein